MYFLDGGRGKEGQYHCVTRLALNFCCLRWATANHAYCSLIEFHIIDNLVSLRSFLKAFSSYFFRDTGVFLFCFGGTGV
jgi:hypothetical protein